MNETELPHIVSGGESLDIFEIMQRFRTDGSCEHLIKEALENLANTRVPVAVGDAISREAAQKGIAAHVSKYRDHYIHCLTKCLPEIIAALPAIQPAAPFAMATDAARRAAEEMVPAVATPPASVVVELKKDIQPWLKEQCSRLMYGQCTTSRCLKRGGYTGGGYSASIATCEAYEVSNALTVARGEQEGK